MTYYWKKSSNSNLIEETTLNTSRIQVATVTKYNINQREAKGKNFSL